MSEPEPLNLIFWFWGDIEELSPANRELRIKFHNSASYREHILDFFLAIHVIDRTDLNDLNVLYQKLLPIYAALPQA